MSCDLTSGRLRGECLVGRAGIKTLYFAKYNDYAALSGITESGGEITSLGADPINLFEFDLENNVGNFEETPTVESSSGTAFITQTVTMTLFQVKGLDLVSLNSLKKGRWVIWTLDFQDKIRMFGTTRGLVASGGSDVSGVAPGDKKGLDLVFTGTNNDLAIFMQDYTTTPFDNFANVTVVEGSNDYSDEYQAVYNSLTTKPSESIAAAQNTMVAALVVAGVWAKLDAFYMFAQTVNTASEALKNWINPLANEGTLVNAPAFVALEGFSGNGTTSYINTNFSAVNDGSNFVQNSGSFGVYVRTNVAESDYEMGFSGGAYDSYIATRTAGDTYLCRINDTNNFVTANTDSRGFHLITRSASNARILYKNGSPIDSDTEASGSPSTDDAFVCTTNNGGSPSTFSTKQISLAFIGANLTQANVTAMMNAIETYMDSNGKGVIP